MSMTSVNIAHKRMKTIETQITIDDILPYEFIVYSLKCSFGPKDFLFNHELLNCGLYKIG